MKIGEWDTLGRARALLQRQLGELKADEFASHVAVNPDNGRLRVLIATNIGLLEYNYAPAADPKGKWLLRGQLVRWGSVRGLRLQTDAQIDANGDDGAQEVWRLVAEDPKIEMAVTSEAPPVEMSGLLEFARACMEHAH